MAQSAANWRNTHTQVDCTHSLTHLHQHNYNHVVRSANSAITEYSGFLQVWLQQQQLAVIVYTVWFQLAVFIFSWEVHVTFPEERQL